MKCEKCNRSASPLVEVITGQGHFVTSEAIGHRQPNIGTPIDFKEKWCFDCFKQSLFPEFDPLEIMEVEK